LNKGNDANTLITQTVVVATMGSMLNTTCAKTTTLTFPAEVMAVVSQLLANQMALTTNGSNVIQPHSFHCSAVIQHPTHSKCDHPQPEFV
jgi:hypothetical protein